MLQSHPSLIYLAVILGVTTYGAINDLRKGEIPDWVPISLVILAVVATACRWSPISWQQLGIGLAIGLAVGVAMFASGGFEGGDAKILAALGAALGWHGLLITLCAMGLVGGVMAVIAMARGKKSIAYGPAIAIGLAIYAILDVWNVLQPWKA